MKKILMVASEASPFAKTGGLADVVGSLPAALNKLDSDVRVIMPRYGKIIDKKLEDPKDILFQEKVTMEHICYTYVNLGWRHLYCGIEQAVFNNVTYYFIDNEYYFNREKAYGYDDDAERYAFFCRAVLEALPHLSFIPDVLHCHDWQAGMVPVLLEAQYREIDQYQHISTVFTIHNLKFQGIYGIPEMKEWFGLGEEYFTEDKLEFFGSGNFMKGGLVYSNILTTVSETYAQEIKYPFFGERLEGLLKAKEDRLFGIINGLGYEDYNLKTDQYIYQTYSKSNLKGKTANKLALQEELKLQVNENIPMIGLVSRLTDQKGLDLISCVLEELMQEEVQFVVLGSGDKKYESLFEEAARDRYPGKLAAYIGYNDPLAHKIYAASDFFLMPSLYEPCGLGQLISMRYGTLPIVRGTGGLKDTVIDYDVESGEGNGFRFANYNAHDMLFTIKRALEIYKRKTLRNKLVKVAMSCDYSWNIPSLKYMELYNKLSPEQS